jgi:hypothetical protein
MSEEKESEDVWWEESIDIEDWEISGEEETTASE